MDDLARYRFDLQGYLLYEDVLDAGALGELRSAIDAEALPPAGETIASQRFGQQGAMLSWHERFRALIDHPIVVEILAQLIGPYVRLDHAYGITMAPGTSGLALHGPAEPFDPAQYYLHRMGAMRSGLLTFSWSLSAASAGDGGFGCIPGSHRASRPIPGGAESLLVEVPQPPGSLLVFTEALAHCTIPWTGSDTRWALLYKYSPGSSAWDPNPPAPADVVALMSPAQRRLCEPPSVGGRLPAIDP